MFGFKKVYCLLSVILFTSTPVFSYAINADSLNSANNNAPKWQGMEIFKHLDDYKTVNTEDYFLNYQDGPAKYGYYLFKTFSDSIHCNLGIKGDIGHSTGCYLKNTKEVLELNALEKASKNKAVEDPNPNGVSMGKSIKTLPAGSKIFMPKLKSVELNRALKSGYGLEANVSLTCVAAKDENVACRNSANHGFVTEGAKVTTF